MTGPEHYRAAETLAFSVTGRDLNTQSVIAGATLAQVHATLALAAATALGREGAGRMMPGRERQAWFDVAAEAPKQVTA